MRYSYDPEADALSIVFTKSGKSSKTVEIDDARYVDLDEQGQVVAIEVLWASHGFSFRDIVERFGLWDHEADLKELQNTQFRPSVAL